MSDANRKSGCMCGKVEVELSGEPAVMAYCHCESCRGWLGAPIHAASLWPTPSVRVVRGEDQLGLFKKTEASHREFCRSCGTPVLIRHPAIGMTDVPAGSVRGLAFKPAMHVHYGEKVLTVRDGLPKYKAMPDASGAGEQLPE